MRFDIITIFPEIFSAKGGSAFGGDSYGYFGNSIIKRAIQNKKIKIKIWNLRDFTKDKHKKVDDRPFGGGPGMVFKIEPIINVVKAICRTSYSKGHKAYGLKHTAVILFSASGKQFDAKLSRNFAKKQNRIIMICGHYEGVDERIKNVLKTMGYKLWTISVGPYVLTGGELPAMVVLDSIARQIPGVLGKTESLEEKRHGVGVPVYTRPEIFSAKGGSASGGKYKKYAVPKVLLSGNHAKINEWRAKHRK